ncbi:MAG: L-seryl-tRNA(Sec) selenium transferase [Candidatus Brocadiaceae bacterium]
MNQNILKNIPSVNELLESPEISRLTDVYPRQFVVDTIRGVLDEIRQSLRSKDFSLNPPVNKGRCEKDAVFHGRNSEEIKESPELENIDVSPHRLCQLIQYTLDQKCAGIEYAINTTGIILHTGLGRAPITEDAARRIQEILKGFCTLEIEKGTGRRGVRYHGVERLICMITGAESALVVNNNAAAVLLTLDTLAQGREAVISRSQLVEIGGSFRMPDVMAKSGSILVEVGTTNKTYVHDYKNAITERTSLILKVHQSNFKIVGFTESVELKDLVSLGQEHNIPVAYDLGSGALIDLQKYGLPHEPTVQEAIKAGVDVVTFSADKLLGGPQGGIIAGKKKWVDLLKKNPLTRALRVGKLTIAGLEATLKLYLEEDIATKKVPVLSMMLTPVEIVEERCKRFIDAIRSKAENYFEISLFDGVSEMGGGSLPGEGIPTKIVSLRSEKISAGALAARLRMHNPPVFARIEQDSVLLDMRTVYDAEVDIIVQALEKIVQGYKK